MATKEEMLAIQNQFLEIHKEVEEELKKIPGVVGVGIGFKETEGKRTKEVSFRVYVTKKKNPKDIAPAEMVPKTIKGFPTDVIELESTQTIEDDSRYRPVKGGIQIGNGSGSVGTLGCLAKLDSDGSWVALSNHHVMMSGDKELSDHVKIGQPDYSSCCCCSCGEIGEVTNASIGGLVDCAIAKLNSGVTSVNEINGIGPVRGVATAVLGEPVRKVGRTTGLTTGEIVDIAYVTTSTASHSFTSQIKIDPAPDVPKFSNNGDSGSAIVNSDDKVVGLLWGGNTGHGVASHINNVTSAMGITIQAAAGTPETAYRMEPARSFTEKYPELAEIADLAWDENNPLVAVVEQHMSEIFRLIRYNRQVMAAWQRKQGPAFVAAFWRSHREENYLVPPNINGVTFTHLLMSMSVALEDTGSVELKLFLQEHGMEVIQSIRHCRSLAELSGALHALGESLAPEKQPTFT